VTKGDEQSLAGIELLAELTEAERQSLEKACAWRSYPAHEQIIDRHSDSRDIFFVVSGRVRVVNYSLSGREISFDDIETGGYFGELAAIDGQPRSANVVALNTTTVATLSPQRLEEMAGRPTGSWISAPSVPITGSMPRSSAWPARTRRTTTPR
jgi:CRP/FNR family cyclic AMP-dependent transcriptional regulator